MFLFRKSLVNKDIERAVAAVQTVIGLGRVVRERKVVPMKVNNKKSIEIEINFCFSIHYQNLLSFIKMHQF